jgi:hypothetical protein
VTDKVLKHEERWAYLPVFRQGHNLGHQDRHNGVDTHNLLNHVQLANDVQADLRVLAVSNRDQFTTATGKFKIVDNSHIHTHLLGAIPSLLRLHIHLVLQKTHEQRDQLLQGALAAKDGRQERHHRRHCRAHVR